MIERGLAVFREGEGFRGRGERRGWGPGHPVGFPLVCGGPEQGGCEAEPVDSPGGLNAPLDEKGGAGAALGGAGDFLAAVDDIERFGAGETGGGRTFGAGAGELGGGPEIDQGGGDPGMDLAITFPRGQGVPGVGGGEHQAVGKVVVVGDKPAAGGPPDEWA